MLINYLTLLGLSFIWSEEFFFIRSNNNQKKRIHFYATMTVLQTDINRVIALRHVFCLFFRIHITVCDRKIHHHVSCIMSRKKIYVLHLKGALWLIKKGKQHIFSVICVLVLLSFHPLIVVQNPCSLLVSLKTPLIARPLQRIHIFKIMS